MRFIPLICFSYIALVATAHGQDYPGCEARPEVNRIIHDELDSQKLNKLPWKERQAVRDRVYNELIAKYPRDLRGHLNLIQDAKWNVPERLPGLRQRYREMAAAHPDDALALVLAAWSLYERDTPESIRLAEAARAKAPNFPYPAVLLAQEYADGLHADKAKLGQNLRGYFAICPSGGNGTAMYLLPKLGDLSLQTSVAQAMRKRLAAETDVTRLDDYQTLWGLEFRATPPAGHDTLRKQVAEDVRRLEALNPKPDSDYFDLLLDGYKQSGASKETLTAFEDRILREAPKGYTAFSIAQERWRKDNKEPQSQTDVAAWRDYNAKFLEATRDWESRFTDVTFLSSMHFNTLFNSDRLTEKDGLAALEAQIAHDREFNQPDPGSLNSKAGMLVKKKWNPELALSLASQALSALPAFEKRQAGSDNLTAADRKERMEYVVYLRNSIAQNTLKAALLAHKPEAAEAVRAQVVSPLEQDAKPAEKLQHWHNLALLAMVDNHRADALTYYQLALQSRPEDPKMVRGKLEDTLKDEAKDLFKQMGGTETAFIQWSARPAMETAEMKEGRWEKPKKELPAFELSDLSGKTWKLKSFEGKTFMINLWATWCGPCQAELPEFQKLYDKVKDRPDVQVITFNVDDELGLVAPFMKDKGYTFPVLLAYDFVSGLLDGIAIPQNWMVDKQGKWRSTQLGYGAEADWVGEMMKRLESTKAEAR